MNDMKYECGDCGNRFNEFDSNNGRRACPFCGETYEATADEDDGMDFDIQPSPSPDPLPWRDREPYPPNDNPKPEWPWRDEGTFWMGIIGPNGEEIGPTINSNTSTEEYEYEIYGESFSQR